MNNQITYAIIKAYKGIFKKKHIGNTQLIIVPLGKTFMLLELLGEHTERDNVYWAVKRLEGDTIFMDSYMMELKATIQSSSEQFVILDQAVCNTKEAAKNEYKISIKAPSSYFKSKSYNLKFNKQYSKSVPLFLLSGKINIEFTDNITPSNVTMVSMKKDAKLKSRLKSIKAKGVRFV